MYIFSKAGVEFQSCTKLISTSPFIPNSADMQARLSQLVHGSLVKFIGKYQPDNKPPLYSLSSVPATKEEAQADPSFEGMPVSFVGQLRQVNEGDPLKGRFRYYLIDAASPTPYYVDGPDKILREFEHETVKVEGKIFSFSQPSPYTTIKLMKIERQL